MAGKFPVVKPKKVIRALKRAGFYTDHVTGSHYIMLKGRRRVTVPYHNKDIPRGLLASIIEQAGLSVEEFLKLL